MSRISDALAEVTAPPVKCLTCKFVATLPPDEQDEIKAIIASAMPHNQLMRLFEKLGHAVTVNAINAHRAKHVAHN